MTDPNGEQLLDELERLRNELVARIEAYDRLVTPPGAKTAEERARRWWGMPLVLVAVGGWLRRHQPELAGLGMAVSIGVAGWLIGHGPGDDRLDDDAVPAPTVTVTATATATVTSTATVTATITPRPVSDTGSPAEPTSPVVAASSRATPTPTGARPTAEEPPADDEEPPTGDGDTPPVGDDEDSPSPSGCRLAVDADVEDLGSARVRADCQ